MLMGVVFYTMVANRLTKTIITAPIYFLILGYILSYCNFIEENDIKKMLHLVAEISLIVLLFVDASKINLKKLRQQQSWPLRMLLIGLPSSIILGSLLAIPFFPHWSIGAIALIAAILSPTDAALGQAVVSNEAVPEKERQTLTVESGLNDGLALPIILFLASLTAVTSDNIDSINWLWFGGKQIILGPIIGGILGFCGGKLFLIMENKRYTAPIYEGVGVLALAGTAYVLASLLGGNGFIAAFIAGLAFGNIVKDHCKFIYEFTETEGQLLIWLSFLLIGLGLVPEAIAHLSWNSLAYILISLFIVRPLAIYFSLIGTDARFVTRIFFGWFGPRGLATALFALLVVHEIHHDYSDAILMLSINAVWISALLHGISSVPAANAYGKFWKKPPVKS